MLTEILQVSLDCYLWADTDRPSIVPIVGPTKKFGGDNSDAFYRFAPMDPRRRYRLRGKRGDAVYLSITVYGGPTDGRWSNRIVATLNDRSMEIEPDGTFEVIVSATEAPDIAALTCVSRSLPTASVPLRINRAVVTVTST